MAKVFTVVRLPATLVVDSSAYFSSDRLGIRATLRVGYGFPTKPRWSRSGSAAPSPVPVLNNSGRAARTRCGPAGHPNCGAATIGVVGHHQRAPQAQRLADTVAAAHIAIDDGTLGAGPNHQRVWDWLAAHHHDTPWCLVLEDDAVPVAGFTHQLIHALAAAPSGVVSLYLGAGYPRHWQPRIQTALHTDAHWLLAEHLFHAVAVAVRTELLPVRLDTRHPADEAISRWARAHRHRVSYTLPSLVDHADGPTLIPHHHDRTPRHRPRRAWRTGTRDHWTTKAAHLA